ncbi:MAG: hypothetical protein QXZ70_01255 [Candidatus Bathyarchaeia archaeon]
MEGIYGSLAATAGEVLTPVVAVVNIYQRQMLNLYQKVILFDKVYDRILVNTR